tara:strand:- start:706 stop:882 length:177 start_codon:yes stop_codon:yes gene_type:complete
MTKTDEQKQREAFILFGVLSKQFDALREKHRLQQYQGRKKLNGMPDKRTREGKVWYAY